MGAVRARLRAELRTRWPAWAGLALLLGLAGGIVLAAAAGARRTATAYPRLLASTRASDVYLSPYEDRLRGSYDEIRHLPQVADAGLAEVPVMAQVSPDGAANLLIFAMASADGRYGYEINRPRVLRGRLPRVGDATEAVVDPLTARRFHVDLGGEITLRAFDGMPADPEHVDPSEGRPATLKVVGIGRFPDRLVPLESFDEFPRLLLSPAAAAEYASAPGSTVFEEIFLRVRPGADLDALRAEVDGITTADPAAGGSDFSLDADRTVKIQRAIWPQALALALFAGIAAVAALLIVGQTVARQIFLDATDYPILRALGMTRGQIVAGIGLRTVAVGVGGAVVAIAVAVASSPLTPIGLARAAEPHPGVAANVGLVAVGGALIVVLLLLVASVPAWRAASRPGGVLGTVELPGADRRSRLAGLLLQTGAPPSAVAGVGLATEPGHGRSAVPVRSTLGGVALAVVTAVASLTFAANLGRLVSHPPNYGQRWDVLLDGAFGWFPTSTTVARLSGDPAIGAYSGGNYGEVVLNGRHVPAVGIDRLRGSVFPTILRGRPPSADDEIVLGTRELRRLHRSVGDSVEVEVAGSPRTMRIVGQAVFPALGLPSFNQTSLGEGAAVTASVLPPASSSAQSPDDIYNFFLVRFRPGATAADRQRLETDTHRRGPFGGSCDANSGPCPYRLQRPADVVNYARVRATPMVLAAVLAGFGAATLAHALVTGIHRRRRDLAILRVLGFVRRQVSAAVVWHATTVAILALAVGLPVGVLVGRWAWIVLAYQLGVRAAPTVPVVPLVLVAVGAVVLANLVALTPARTAGAIGVAEVLREP